MPSNASSKVSPTKMSDPAQLPSRSLGIATVTWLHTYGRSTFLARDARLAAVTFAGTTILAYQNGDVRSEAVPILITAAALGAGFLAVVLAALAILVTFFDEGYRKILANTPRGIAGAMMPYKTVAVIGGATGGVALIGATAWPALTPASQAGVIGVTLGLLVWAGAGTLQLVDTTIFHGVQRAKLLEALAEYRSRRSA